MYLHPLGWHALLSCSASKPLLANSASSFTKRYFPSVGLFRKTIITRKANLNTIFNTVFDDYMKTSSYFSSISWLVSGTFCKNVKRLIFHMKTGTSFIVTDFLPSSRDFIIISVNQFLWLKTNNFDFHEIYVYPELFDDIIIQVKFIIQQSIISKIKDINWNALFIAMK